MPRRRDKDLLAAIGAQIQKIRQQRGLTQQRLAEAIGVESETVSRAETGAMAMSLANLQRMADALQCSLADLVDPSRVLPVAERRPDEVEVLQLLNGLDDEGRAAAVDVLRVLARRWRQVPGGD